MKVNAQLVHAAMQFQATKDVRFYLNGIHFRNGIIEGTNGHVLGQMESDHIHDDEFPDKTIIQFKKKSLPMKVVELDLIKGDGDEVIVKHLDNKGVCVDISMASIIDGRFPDTEKPIKSAIEESDGKVMRLQSKYLGLISKAFRKDSTSVEMMACGESSATYFKITHHTSELEHIVLIMPMKKR